MQIIEVHHAIIFAFEIKVFTMVIAVNIIVSDTQVTINSTVSHCPIMDEVSDTISNHYLNCFMNILSCYVDCFYF